MLVLSLLVSYILSANWWESGGLPVTFGIVFLMGTIGGTREYGFLYALIPAYVFLVPIIEGAVLVNITGPEPVFRKILGAVLLPLLITVPIVGAGYLIGTGIHLLRNRATAHSGRK